MNGWSASNLSRGLECPAHYELQHTTWKPIPVRKAAYRGTAIHSYIEEIAIGVPPLSALERTPSEYQEICSKIDIPGFVPLGSEMECSFVYNISQGKARYIGKGLKRNYNVNGELAFSDIPGTADIVFNSDSRIVLRDVKTGRTPVPKATENPQLLQLSLGASEQYGKTNLEVGIVRIKEDGSHEIDAGEVTEIDLDVFRDKLSDMHRRRLQARLKPKEEWIEGTEIKEGSHCKYCPARQRCPIKIRKRAAAKLKKESKL